MHPSIFRDVDEAEYKEAIIVRLNIPLPLALFQTHRHEETLSFFRNPAPPLSWCQEESKTLKKKVMQRPSSIPSKRILAFEFSLFPFTLMRSKKNGSGSCVVVVESERGRENN
ncbi:hypothetical protein L2E82_28236 [Cichorium intybus]|uniref:Uncharacterized protein n=1 Tax=Cichorium intybus TaxID=13427 RepID=A0ACB9CVM7_CICIN|nr:hypothetical protein L2E82_28236 [Cichorium intybus]